MNFPHIKMTEKGVHVASCSKYTAGSTENVGLIQKAKHIFLFL